MNPQRHVIKKQILDLQLSSQQNAFALQTQISHIYRTKLVPLIDHYCNQLCDSETLYRIDKLTLDLGTVHLDTLETDLIDKVTAALRAQLGHRQRLIEAELITSLTPPDIPSPPVMGTNPHPFGSRYSQLSDAADAQSLSSSWSERSQPASSHPSDPTTISFQAQRTEQKPGPELQSRPEPLDRPVPLREENKSQTGPVSQSPLELICYFIQTGRLPWWAPPLSKSELEAQFAQLITAEPARVTSILTSSSQQKHHLQRIIYQFSDALLVQIAQLWSSQRSRSIVDLYEDVTVVCDRLAPPHPFPPEQLRLECWRGIYLSLMFAPTIPPTELARATLQQIITAMPTSDRGLMNQIKDIVQGLNDQNFNFKSALPHLFRQVSLPLEADILKQDTPTTLQVHSSPPPHPPHPGTQERTVIISDRLDPIMHPADVPDDRASVNQPVEKQLVSPSMPSTGENSTNLSLPRVEQSDPAGRFTSLLDDFTTSEEIYIHNSGLVLLWPFLERFFESNYLVERHHFIEPRSAEKAVLLLQYCVDSDSDPSEHQLPLNKLLCGIDLAVPIAPSIELCKMEQLEIEGLLSAVIHNWSVLKNTSVHGLRTAFLQREGILQERDGDWVLQVEQKTYDILLDQLPWSVRVVKLPWMETILHVEW